MASHSVSSKRTRRQSTMSCSFGRMLAKARLKINTPSSSTPALDRTHFKAGIANHPKHLHPPSLVHISPVVPVHQQAHAFPPIMRTVSSTPEPRHRLLVDASQVLRLGFRPGPMDNLSIPTPTSSLIARRPSRHQLLAPDHRITTTSDQLLPRPPCVISFLRREVQRRTRRGHTNILPYQNHSLPSTRNIGTAPIHLLLPQPTTISMVARYTHTATSPTLKRRSRCSRINLYPAAIRKSSNSPPMCNHLFRLSRTHIRRYLRRRASPARKERCQLLARESASAR